MDLNDKYYIGCDPYDRLNWFQELLKKTGLFYKDRPYVNTVTAF